MHLVDLSLLERWHSLQDSVEQGATVRGRIRSLVRADSLRPINVLVMRDDATP